jgi:hypothetical protein
MCVCVKLQLYSYMLLSRTELNGRRPKHVVSLFLYVFSLIIMLHDINVCHNSMCSITTQCVPQQYVLHHNTNNDQHEAADAFIKL